MWFAESEVGALTVVFIENIILHGVNGRPAKGMVPELAQQLDVPKSTLFSEVHKLFRSAGRNTSNNNGGGMAARASSRTNLKRVDSNASTESGRLDRTSSNRSLHKAPSSGSVRRGANSSRKLLQSTSTSSMASRSSAHRLVRAGSKKK